MLPPPSILLSCLLHIQGSQGKDYFSLCVHLAASTMGSAALLNACMRSSTWGRGKRLLCALCIGSWGDRHVVTSHRSLESPVPCWGHSMWLGKDKVGAVGKQQGCALATAGQGQGRTCMFGEWWSESAGSRGGDGICCHGQQALQVCGWHTLAQEPTCLSHLQDHL